MSIVLLEDDPDIAALIIELLAELGHGARHLRDSASVVPDDAVHLAITDLLSVGAADPEKARAWVATLRAAYPTAKVVVVTAYGAVLPAGPGGPDALISKPFAIDDFIHTVSPFLPQA